MPTFVTFAASDAYLGARSERSVNGIRATNLYRQGPDTIVVTYHGTPVVYQRRDGTFILDGSAYRSVTTKERMNAFSPARISQVEGEWYNHGQLLHYGLTPIGPDGRYLPEGK